MEDGPVVPLPTLEPISRPSSTSTTASVAQLPGISALATGGSASNSPQLRAANVPTPTPMMASSPGATVPTASGNLPTCHNCSTSTTPLWRRDEMGSVLCNACGLFLKLHGRPRPISLKTDVIKSRNRVKTMRPDMQMKKKSLPAAPPIDHNGVNLQAHENATAALAAIRRTSQNKTNGHGDDANSPVSRTATPSMYDPHLGVFAPGMDAHQFQSASLAQYPLQGGSPGRPASPMNGEHLDIPQTHEQLMATNSSLKTRVSELEVINELYRGRLTQLESDQQVAEDYRHQAEVSVKNEATERALREESQRRHEDTQRLLEDSHRRENILKRRLDEMEQELKEAKEKIEMLERDESDRPCKKPRLEDKTNESEALSTPQPES